MTDANKSSRQAGAWSAPWIRGLFAESIRGLISVLILDPSGRLVRLPVEDLSGHCRTRASSVFLLDPTPGTVSRTYKLFIMRIRCKRDGWSMPMTIGSGGFTGTTPPRPEIESLSTEGVTFPRSTAAQWETMSEEDAAEQLQKSLQTHAKTLKQPAWDAAADVWEVQQTVSTNPQSWY